MLEGVRDEDVPADLRESQDGNEDHSKVVIFGVWQGSFLNPKNVIMLRALEPELLDDLPPSDSRAVGSREDLRRVNCIMGNMGILSRVIHQTLTQSRLCSQPLRLVELGGGDGTLMLRLARHWSGLGVKAHVTLIDRQGLVSDETRRRFVLLQWRLNNVVTDVFSWLEQKSPTFDVMIANLFLHHFSEEQLRTLFGLAAMRTNLFVACEPRRSPLGLAASRLIWLLGCNAITKHDAVISVKAGFDGNELSALWPQFGHWAKSEHSAGMFSHRFVAKLVGNGNRSSFS